MRRFFRAAIVAGALPCAAAAQGAPPRIDMPVIVNNTPAQPVPVQGGVTIQGTPAVAIQGTPAVNVTNTPTVLSAQDGPWTVRTSDDPSKLFQLELTFNVAPGEQKAYAWLEFPAVVTLRQVSASCANNYRYLSLGTASIGASPAPSPAGTRLTSANGSVPPDEPNYATLYSGGGILTFSMKSDAANSIALVEPTAVLLRSQRFRVLVRKQSSETLDSCTTTLVGTSE